MRRFSFFIACNQKPQSTLEVWMVCYESLGGEHHRCQRAFHIGGPSSINDVLNHGECKRVVRPRIRRTRGDYVSMPSENERRAGFITLFHGPKVFYVGKVILNSLEAKRSEGGVKNILTPGIIRGDRAALNESPG